MDAYFISILEKKQKEDGWLLISTNYNDLFGMKIRIEDKINT